MPITKRSRITPISAKRFNAEISDNIPTPPRTSVGGPPSGKTHDQKGDRGPINIPAKRYPMIKGCLILKNASVTTAPIIIMKAKSVTKLVWGNSGVICSIRLLTVLFKEL